MTKDKALKMAIEAMENSIVRCKDLHHAKKDQHKDSGQCPIEQRWNTTIQACKEALEPQIELADTISVEDYQKLREQPTKEEILGKVFDAVYAQYPKKEWQGLSDDEIDRIYCEVSDNCVKYFPSELYAAWFKALKEKNI